MNRRFRLFSCIIVVPIAFLAVLEALLRISSAFVDNGRRIESASRPARASPLALFAGDSQIYGLWVNHNETLPAQAAAIVRKGGPAGFAATNYGRNGAPSWVALEDLRDALPADKPDAVVIRIGYNNLLSTAPEDETFWTRLRIARLSRMVYYGWRGDVFDADQAVGGVRDGMRGVGSGSPANDTNTEFWLHKNRRGGRWRESVSPRLRRDLYDMAQLAKASGARVFFISYLTPAEPFGLANRDLEWAAWASGSAYVDLTWITMSALAAQARLDFLHADGHPTALGYALEARALVRAFVNNGFITMQLPPDPIELLSHLPPSAPASGAAAKVELTKRGGANGKEVFVIKGAPLCRGSLWIGRRCGGLALASGRLPIDPSEAQRYRSGAPELDFVLDESGVAEVAPSEQLLAKLEPGVHAVALVMGTGKPVPAFAISDAVPVGGGK